MKALRLVSAVLVGLLTVAACAANSDSMTSSGTATRHTQGMGGGYTRGGGSGY